VMGSGMINNAGVAGPRRIMGRTMDHHLVHSFGKSSIADGFHLERSFLPMLETGKRFHFHDPRTINIGSRGDFLDHPQDIYALFIIPAMVDPEFSTGNIETFPQSFKGFYWHIVNRKPRPSRFTVIL